MTHIEVHKIKGRRYKYEVTNYRMGKKIKHKWRYLGPLEPVNKIKISSGGRKPKLRVRELRIEDKALVNKSVKHSESFVKDRAKIIKLSSEGNTIKQICQKLKFDKKKVGKIIREFNEKGFKIFERKKSSGRPRRMTKEERAKVLQFVNTNPAKLELHFTNWSHKKLSDYAKKQKIIVSPSQVRKIIKQDEIKYKKKQPKLYSNDKNFFRKS